MIIFRRIICLLLAMLDIYLYRTQISIFSSTKQISSYMSMLREYQKLRGFGASACWWSKLRNSEYADDVAQKLYSRRTCSECLQIQYRCRRKDNPNSRIGRWRATKVFTILMRKR